MPLYHYIHDADWFRDRFVPALTRCRLRHSFLPCLPICLALAPQIEAFSDRFRLCKEVPLIGRLDERTAYDHLLWRHVVGELLLYGAVDVPELPQAPDTLCCLLAPDARGNDDGAREQMQPIQQVHLGARDLCFGPTFYRPDHAGWNDTRDVQRLAAYLGSIDASTWSLPMLAAWPDDADMDERAEELEFARECLRSLLALYEEASKVGRVIVCERIE